MSEKEKQNSLKQYYVTDWGISLFNLIKKVGKVPLLKTYSFSDIISLTQFKKSSSLIGLGFIFIFLLLIIWKIPQFQVPSNSSISEKERITLEYKARGTLIQVIGGLFFFVTAYLTWKNSEISHKQLLATQEKQITERFSKAVEQLGNEQSITVRLGAIYSLERIAKDSKDDHWTIMEVLTAFVREKSNDTRETDSKIPQDIQVALTVIGRRNTENDPKNGEIDLRGANLNGANLVGAKLNNANLEKAEINNANLEKAELNEAEISYAKLNKTNLIESQLNKARLYGAELKEAYLNGAILNEAILGQADLFKASLNMAQLVNTYLKKANLEGTDIFQSNLTEVDLQGANLTGALVDDTILINANLKDANLKGTNLRGANLTGANLTRANLELVDLTGANLTGANLTGVRNIADAILTKTDLQDTIFYDGKSAYSRTNRLPTLEQIITAKNWGYAIYTPDFEEKLQQYLILEFKMAEFLRISLLSENSFSIYFINLLRETI